MINNPDVISTLKSENDVNIEYENISCPNLYEEDNKFQGNPEEDGDPKYLICWRKRCKKP